MQFSDIKIKCVKDSKSKEAIKFPSLYKLLRKKINELYPHHKGLRNKFIQACKDSRDERILDKFYHASFLFGNSVIDEVINEYCTTSPLKFLFHKNRYDQLLSEGHDILPRHIKYLKFKDNDDILKKYLAKYNYHVVLTIIDLKGLKIRSNHMIYFLKFASTTHINRREFIIKLIDLWDTKLSPPIYNKEALTLLAKYELCHNILDIILEKVCKFIDWRFYIEYFYRCFMDHEKNIVSEGCIGPFTKYIYPCPKIMFNSGVKFGMSHLIKTASNLALLEIERKSIINSDLLL
jgi:hypothetical protein